MHFLFHSDILQQKYGGNKELIPIDFFFEQTRVFFFSQHTYAVHKELLD